MFDLQRRARRQEGQEALGLLAAGSNGVSLTCGEGVAAMAYGRHQPPRARVPRGGVLAGSRGTYPTRSTCVATLLGSGARTGRGDGRRAARRAQVPARAAGRPEASRDTSPAVRARLLRGDQEVLRACILSKVPVPVPRSSARPRSACKGARTRRTRFVGAPQRVREEPSPPRSRAAAGSLLLMT